MNTYLIGLSGSGFQATLRVMLQEKGSEARQAARGDALLGGPLRDQYPARLSRRPHDPVVCLYTRQCLEIAVGRRLPGQDVAATLERLRFDRGRPRRIRCDNETEFVSATMDLWAHTTGVVLDFSRRGKPTSNRIRFFE